MRLTVMAADRAATMATTIQKTCCTEGQPCGGWCVARAASSAPVSANGSANTECSNLIISSTVRMRPCCIAASGIGFLRRQAAGPAIHLFLWKIDLRQNAAHVLCDQIVDGFRMMIKRGHRGHDHRSRLLRAQHIFQMDAVKRSVAHAQNQL